MDQQEYPEEGQATNITVKTQHSNSSNFGQKAQQYSAKHKGEKMPFQDYAQKIKSDLIALALGDDENTHKPNHPSQHQTSSAFSGGNHSNLPPSRSSANSRRTTTHHHANANANTKRSSQQQMATGASHNQNPNPNPNSTNKPLFPSVQESPNLPPKLMSVESQQNQPRKQVSTTNSNSQGGSTTHFQRQGSNVTSGRSSRQGSTKNSQQRARQNTNNQSSGHMVVSGGFKNQGAKIGKNGIPTSASSNRDARSSGGHNPPRQTSSSQRGGRDSKQDLRKSVTSNKLNSSHQGGGYSSSHTNQNMPPRAGGPQRNRQRFGAENNSNQGNVALHHGRDQQSTSFDQHSTGGVNGEQSQQVVLPPRRKPTQTNSARSLQPLDSAHSTTSSRRAKNHWNDQQNHNPAIAYDQHLNQPVLNPNSIIGNVASGNQGSTIIPAATQAVDPSLLAQEIEAQKRLVELLRLQQHETMTQMQQNDYQMQEQVRLAHEERQNIEQLILSSTITIQRFARGFITRLKIKKVQNLQMEYEKSKLDDIIASMQAQVQHQVELAPDTPAKSTAKKVIKSQRDNNQDQSSMDKIVQQDINQASKPSEKSNDLTEKHPIQDLQEGKKEEESELKYDMITKKEEAKNATQAVRIESQLEEVSVKDHHHRLETENNLQQQQPVNIFDQSAAETSQYVSTQNDRSFQQVNIQVPQNDYSEKEIKKADNTNGPPKNLSALEETQKDRIEDKSTHSAKQEPQNSETKSQSQKEEDRGILDKLDENSDAEGSLFKGDGYREIEQAAIKIQRQTRVMLDRNRFRLALYKLVLLKSIVETKMHKEWEQQLFAFEQLIINTEDFSEQNDDSAVGPEGEKDPKKEPKTANDEKSSKPQTRDSSPIRFIDGDEQNVEEKLQELEEAIENETDPFMRQQLLELYNPLYRGLLDSEAYFENTEDIIEEEDREDSGEVSLAEINEQDSNMEQSTMKADRLKDMVIKPAPIQKQKQTIQNASLGALTKAGAKIYRDTQKTQKDAVQKPKDLRTSQSRPQTNFVPNSNSIAPQNKSNVSQKDSSSRSSQRKAENTSTVPIKRNTVSQERQKAVIPPKVPQQKAQAPVVQGQDKKVLPKAPILATSNANTNQSQVSKPSQNNQTLPQKPNIIKNVSKKDIVDFSKGTTAAQSTNNSRLSMAAKSTTNSSQSVDNPSIKATQKVVTTSDKEETPILKNDKDGQNKQPKVVSTPPADNSIIMRNMAALQKLNEEARLKKESEAAKKKEKEDADQVKIVREPDLNRLQALSNPKPKSEDPNVKPPKPKRKAQVVTRQQLMDRAERVRKRQAEAMEKKLEAAAKKPLAITDGTTLGSNLVLDPNHNNGVQQYGYSENQSQQSLRDQARKTNIQRSRQLRNRSRSGSRKSSMNGGSRQASRSNVFDRLAKEAQQKNQNQRKGQGEQNNNNTVVHLQQTRNQPAPLPPSISTQQLMIEAEQIPEQQMMARKSYEFKVRKAQAGQAKRASQGNLQQDSMHQQIQPPYQRIKADPVIQGTNFELHERSMMTEDGLESPQQQVNHPSTIKKIKNQPKLGANQRDSNPNLSNALEGFSMKNLKRAEAVPIAKSASEEDFDEMPFMVKSKKAKHNNNQPTQDHNQMSNAAIYLNNTTGDDEDQNLQSNKQVDMMQQNPMKEFSVSMINRGPSVQKQAQQNDYKYDFAGMKESNQINQEHHGKSSQVLAEPAVNKDRDWLLDPMNLYMRGMAQKREQMKKIQSQIVTEQRAEINRRVQHFKS